MWVLASVAVSSLAFAPATGQFPITATPPVSDRDIKQIELDSPKGPAQPKVMPASNDRWRRDHLRVLPPTMEGTGMLIAGIAAVSAVFAKQIVFVHRCGDPGCRSGRLSDRLLWISATAALGYGSSLRARHFAYHDALRQQLRPRNRRREIWGTILMGMGAIAFLTDIGLQSACMLGKGPYFINDQTTDPNSRFFYGCEGWAGTIMMDLGGAALAAGTTLRSWESSYQRDRNVYRRGRLRLVPRIGGLTAVGRF